MAKVRRGGRSVCGDKAANARAASMAVTGQMEAVAAAGVAAAEEREVGFGRLYTAFQSATAQGTVGPQLERQASSELTD